MIDWYSCHFIAGDSAANGTEYRWVGCLAEPEDNHEKAFIGLRISVTGWWETNAKYLLGWDGGVWAWFGRGKHQNREFSLTEFMTLGYVKHLYWLSRIPVWRDSAKTEHLLQEKGTYYWLFLCSLQSVMLLCCHLNHCMIVSYWRVHFNSYLGMEDSSRFLKKWQVLICESVPFISTSFYIYAKNAFLTYVNLEQRP